MKKTVKLLNKSQRKIINSGRITKELLVSIIFTVNRQARALCVKNIVGHEKIDYLYQIKEKLLLTFFQPIEIHEIKCKQYLFYKYGSYEFHIPFSENTKKYSDLKIYKIERSYPTQRSFTQELPLNTCLDIVNRIDRLVLC